jgi:hypothetical protein
MSIIAPIVSSLRLAMDGRGTVCEVPTLIPSNHTSVAESVGRGSVSHPGFYFGFDLRGVIKARRARFDSRT